MEDDLSLAILDINPLSKCHCLVVPKRHVPWWHDLSDEEVESLFRLARAAARKISKVFEPDFVCMYARGRRIPHTHIIPGANLQRWSHGQIIQRPGGLPGSSSDLIGLEVEEFYGGDGRNTKVDVK